MQPKNRHVGPVLLLLFSCWLPSCALFGHSPGSAVEQFYRHLNAGEYSKAKELYDAESRQLVDGQLMALGGGFSNWADTETRKGTIEKVTIVNSQVRGEGATVDYAIVYKDGSTVSKTVSLTKEGGYWKIGLIR